MSGPLSHYPANPAAIRGNADRAKQAHEEYVRLAEDLDDAARRASFEVGGDLTAPTEDAARKQATAARELSEAALLAYGVLNTWAGDIEIYNAQIDALNLDWEMQQANDFGVWFGSWYDPQKTDKQNSQARADAVGAARAVAWKNLHIQADLLLQALEDKGDQGAAALDAGPTAANLWAYASDVMGYEYTLAAAEGVDRFSFLRDLTVASVPELGSKLDDFLRNARDAGVLRDALKNPKLEEQFWEIMNRGIEEGYSTGARWRMGYYDGIMRSQRFSNLIDALGDTVRPGPLIGEAAPFVGQWFAGLGESSSAAMRGLGSVNQVAGKALAPLALFSGIYGAVDEAQNWGHMSTEDKVVDSVINGGSIIAGGVGTALLLGATFIPGGVVVVAGVAGLVALGATVYKYRKEIAGAVGSATKFIGSVDAAVAHGAADVAHGTGQLADAALSGAGDIADNVAHAYGSEAKAAGQAAGAVLDHVDPRLGTAAREAGAAASHAIDDAGDAAKHAAHAVGDGISHAADAVAHGLDDAGDAVSEGAKTIGNAIGGLFG